MTKPTVYLDTSVINFLFADDAPEKKEITEAFFEDFIKLSIYDTYITEYVLDEINQTRNEENRNRLLRVFQEYPISLLPLKESAEVVSLAEAYLDGTILPVRKILDALHVACCTVAKIDYLVSWNFKHLANINREQRILAKNYELGYKYPLKIITPIELIDYGT
ncbi:PIN domain-containing protein [Salmonirosea aquatica]|uniref:PIN domain-containing protein n=1 Tax=Salmonirosea aquatica TaxID=2654236 RepID=A0A7C9F2C3_9BACT|nr:hypothetical protein [Cytophagaceae bacterium SJW1-29]